MTFLRRSLLTLLIMMVAAVALVGCGASEEADDHGAVAVLPSPTALPTYTPYPTSEPIATAIVAPTSAPVAEPFLVAPRALQLRACAR